jgi:uncharacterized BrkB/YihY/UPF0761 family membrane protein
MTDLLTPTPDAVDWDEEPEIVHTPLIPIFMLALTALTAFALVAYAIGKDAGQTDEISDPAALAWVFGALLGLLIFAWFGLLDSVRRSTGNYEEPAWKPRTVAAVLAVVGWVAGSAGAFLVAEAVARR